MTRDLLLCQRDTSLKAAICVRVFDVDHENLHPNAERLLRTCLELSHVLDVANDQIRALNTTDELIMCQSRSGPCFEAFFPSQA